jgi:hypothetical protein
MGNPLPELVTRGHIGQNIYAAEAAATDCSGERLNAE